MCVTKYGVVGIVVAEGVVEGGRNARTAGFIGITN